MRVCFLDEGDIDCRSKLTLLCSPIFLDIVCELFNLIFICFLTHVRNEETAVLSFVLEEVLFRTRVNPVHVVINIFDSLHFRQVLDVVDHVEVYVAHFPFI